MLKTNINSNQKKNNELLFKRETMIVRIEFITVTLNKYVIYHSIALSA